jgi:5-methylcytosine-specific restriction endonuclease McrA
MLAGIPWREQSRERTIAMNDFTTPQDVLLKHCPKCQTIQPLDNFSPDKSRPDRHDGYCKACRKMYRIQNRERLIAASAKWNKENPERFAENVRRSERKWLEKTLAHWRAAERRYRARKLNAAGTHTAADIQAQYKRQKGCCYYCGVKVGDTYHADHVIPLSRGGSNGPENIVIACPKCNLSKNDKLLSEWPQGGRLL